MGEMKGVEVQEEEDQLEVVVKIDNIQNKINITDAKREDGNKFFKK